MAQIVEIALSNLIVASLLAFLAALAGLWGKRPALTHALWLLVMAKLITPPFFTIPIDWRAPPTPELELIVQQVVQVKVEPDVIVLPVGEPAIPPADDEMIPMADMLEVEPNAELVSPVLPVVLPVVEPLVAEASWPWLDCIALAWFFGSACWLSIAMVRLLRFERTLRFASPASIEVRVLAEQLAADMAMRCPEVCVVPGKISPMLWALWGMPRLVLPSELIARLPSDQLAAMLVHELAHWRRRDDRTRWLEILVFALYWWCPLAWWARRELHQAEEECCDAWVVSQLPESAKAYAFALVETVDFLSDAPTSLPVAASGLGHVRLLKRRLTMILNGRTPRALTFTGLLGVAGLGLLMLPMVPGWAQPPRGGDEVGEEQQQREKKGEREKGPGGPQGGGLQELRAEVQRLQAEMEKRRAEMEQRMAQMRELMEHLRRMEQGNQGGQRPFGPMGGGEGKKKGGPGGGFGGPGGNAGGGQGGGPGGNPGGGFGGPMGGGGGFGGGPRPGGDQRLNEVERKLDQLLQEVRMLRGELKGKQGGPGAFGGGPNPMRNPNPNPNPNPRPGTPNTRPGAERQPSPPTPPTPPAKSRPRGEDQN